MYPWPSDDLNLKITLTSIWHWPSDDHDKFTQKSLHCQKVDVWKSHSANTLVYSKCCVFCTASVLHVHTISCHEYIVSTPLQICHDLVLPCLPSPSLSDLPLCILLLQTVCNPTPSTFSKIFYILKNNLRKIIWWKHIEIKISVYGNSVHFHCCIWFVHEMISTVENGFVQHDQRSSKI